MRYSFNERLILIEIYRLKLILDEKNSSLYNQKIDILSLGIESEYHKVDSEISELGIDCETSSYVKETLDLFILIKNSISKLPENQKSSSFEKLIFKGFSIINEYEFYSYANYLIKYEPKYFLLRSDFRRNQPKSFMECIPYYMKVKNEFETLEIDNGQLLSLSQLYTLASIV